MRLDHVGIATDDLDALADLYAALLGCPVAHREHFEGTEVVFLDCGDTSLELLEPADGGVVANYLDEHGPGIHHAAFETGDIDAVLDHVRNLGVELVDEEPRPGAWGHEVAFLHPRSTGGVLIEFVEH